MDLSYTPEQDAFRTEVRDWLRANVPPEPLANPGSPDGFAAHRAWDARLAEAGYATLQWPVEYGGRGADVVMQAIFQEEYYLARAPERVSVIGYNLMGPTLMVHGTGEQKTRWLPGIISAGEIWSQGFSEPEAGSDLAGIRTRAVLDGDDWVVNGQKIWTSYGAWADWIFALVRTDPEASRHAGITFLAIDLRSSGVDPRPIAQLDGYSGFAEVFFADVRVPASNVIGEVNDGWTVAMTTLGFERDAPAAPPARFAREVHSLVEIAQARGLGDDPAVRDRIASLHVRAESYRHHALRTLTKLARGETLGSEASRTKLLWSELERDAFETGMELLGPYGEALADTEALAGAERWHTYYWFARAATIYAGTSEIQRNILAERVLGLPKG
jgi:alkylation response protein AidB-like acyl-CoA dehydrogenase